MRLKAGIFVDNKATFGELKFSAMRREVKERDEEGKRAGETKERTFDLKSRGQKQMIQVSIPAEAGKKEFEYDTVVEMVNPVVDTVANARGKRGAEVGWYIKADDIIIKKPEPVNQPNQQGKEQAKPEFSKK